MHDACNHNESLVYWKWLQYKLKPIIIGIYNLKQNSIQAEFACKFGGVIKLWRVEIIISHFYGERWFIRLTKYCVRWLDASRFKYLIITYLHFQRLLKVFGRSFKVKLNCKKNNWASIFNSSNQSLNERICIMCRRCAWSNIAHVRVFQSKIVFSWKSASFSFVSPLTVVVLIFMALLV